VSVFRRKNRSGGAQDPDDGAASVEGEDEDETAGSADHDTGDRSDAAEAAEAAEEAEEAEEAEAPGRPSGPWDVADAPDDDTPRLDLGSIRVPTSPDLEVQVNLDEASGSVLAVSLLRKGSALQLQAFAAPRGEGIWAEVRKELAAEITKDGGIADLDSGGDTDAPTGSTVRARLPFPQPDGTVSLGVVRFIGTDGPRWLLRGVLSGPAATDPAAASPLLSVYRGVVVVRGSDPFAPRDPLPLRLPDQPIEEQPGGGRPPLDTGGSGQQIAEIR
jgi:hypothetical protein